MANKKVYTVNEINRIVKGLFAQEFLFDSVSVLGEISNLKFNQNGHIYFSLKGENSVINGAMFNGVKQGLQNLIKDGDQVVITGKIDVYEAQGRYQLYARTIEKAGVGQLLKQFEELKQRLSEAGYFDESYKKPIPKYPMTVGIISSPTAAGFGDIVRVATLRNPYVQLILSPALMQGQGAPKSVINALRKLDAIHPDVIIIARGGGSMEDLWCFNDEELAMEVFHAETPIVTGIGHEQDFTIIDFVADQRASTPTNAAEICTFDANQFIQDLDMMQGRMKNSLELTVQRMKNNLKDFEKRIALQHPKSVLLKHQNQLSDMKNRMKSAMEVMLQRVNQRHLVLTERLEGLSPLKKLVNGFGYVSAHEKPIQSVSEVAVGDEVKLTLHDGTCSLEVKEVH